MSIDLTFTEILRYDEQPTGISIPVALQYEEQAITTEAKLIQELRFVSSGTNSDCDSEFQSNGVFRFTSER